MGFCIIQRVVSNAEFMLALSARMFSFHLAPNNYPFEAEFF
jgi:hypothetical protein